MKQNSCNIYTSSLCKTQRKEKNESIVLKKESELHITFCEDDSFEKFESDLSKITGSSFFYSIKKKFSATFISVVSVIVLMFAFISASIYEDLFKKIIFELPFSWEFSDTVSLIFVIVFFIGLVMMPSLLDGEGDEFKNILSSWFNKDVKKLKRLKLAFSLFDKKTSINLYNFDIARNDHWIFNLLLKSLLLRFNTINLYIRNDKVQNLQKKLTTLGALNIEVINPRVIFTTCDIEFLLSNKEQKLYSLMQLSSSKLLKSQDKKIFISFELFEYCGKSFFQEQNDSKHQLISGFQNFINRSFDDFNFIAQEKSMQIYFTSNCKFKDLQDEEKRLSYYLRNHIEECVSYFNNPMSLIILYYYVKDIVLDEKRTILILEKFIKTVEKKQQYELINDYWFDIAEEMFDSSSIDSFETTTNSIYRKISTESLNKLIFLFERNGYFEQAILIAKYLYEINPNKYSITLCSLYERMGQFEKAYASLPSNLDLTKNEKPNDIQVRYFQRKAWIVVSQRKEGLKQEGEDTLKSLKELIFSHNDDNEPIWLWHYYNIKANYSEWNEDYSKAISNYKKCLAIPTLGAFEYGATFVNMAIAYRFKYLTSNTQKVDIINKSIKLGNLGIYLKKAVGDRDEMPVVLHNQALNLLCKILNNDNSDDVDKELCEEIINITDEAISILDKTLSIKRLGMLLIENYIAKSILEKETRELSLRLKAHIYLLDENETKQLLELYKKFIISDKICKLDFLDKL